jgi:formylglycine-generating enzyme required for sulfatase activity
VPAATKPLEEAPELACNELGDWYRALAGQATAPTIKGAMLQRAKAYYERFLELHKADDLARTGASLMMKKIDDALAKLGSAAESRSGPSSLTLDLGKGVTMKLVRIRPGKFMMGEEKDPHEVTISKPFYLGVTVLTQAQYEAVIGTNPSQFKGPTNPVEQVSWNDAAEFCKKLSEKARRAVRLPTEAEWEYACRAGNPGAFCFGDAESELEQYAWYAKNSGGKTQPVGQKKPNQWGLYDMHGNVWEWCQDWKGQYRKGPITDPTGPEKGASRVLRAGSWGNNNPAVLRSAFRSYFLSPARRTNGVGFRCVWVAGSSP